MGGLHNPFPIDLVLADQLFPVMETTAKHLENIPRIYSAVPGAGPRAFPPSAGMMGEGGRCGMAKP